MVLTEISIKDGMPTVKEAREILEFEIKRAKKLNLKCIKIIHGYGSTGVGGKIKTMVRNVLNEKKQNGEIKNFVLGQDWSIFNQLTRDILNTIDEARNDSDLDKFNIGISIVVL